MNNIYKIHLITDYVEITSYNLRTGNCWLDTKTNRPVIDGSIDFLLSPLLYKLDGYRYITYKIFSNENKLFNAQFCPVTHETYVPESLERTEGERLCTAFIAQNEKQLFEQLFHLFRLSIQNVADTFERKINKLNEEIESAQKGFQELTALATTISTYIGE